MRSLLQKGASFQWTKEHTLEFEALRQALASRPVMTLFDPGLPILLKTDASQMAVAAILAHVIVGKEHVVAYYSAALSKSQQKWSVINKELFAMVAAVKKFRQFLEGSFTFVTDHHSLCYLFGLREPPALLARWLMYLMPFRFNSVYRKGKCNLDVDCLSHLVYEITAPFTKEINFVAMEDIIDA